MDVCLPSDFLALRACVDSDWRDGCAGFSNTHIRAEETEYALHECEIRTHSRRDKNASARSLTSVQADPAWQVI